MLTLLFATLLGLLVGLGCFWSGLAHWGWSTFWGVLAFVASNSVVGFILQRKVKFAMMCVQNTIASGQKRLKDKMNRWQMKPPSSIQEAQREMDLDQRKFSMDAIRQSEMLRVYQKWVPLMKRQIATLQIQLYWTMGDMKKVDELMPHVLLVDPLMSCMKMARMYQREVCTKEIEKTYRKATRHLRYNQNVLLAGTFSWILMKRNEIDAAFHVLTQALEKSDNSFLKANHSALANNRIAHFSNAGLGEMWYALLLEKPKMRIQRPRMQWR